MEEVYINALTERAKLDEAILDSLPDDVKARIEERLTTEIQEAVVESDNGSDNGSDIEPETLSHEDNETKPTQ